MSDQDIPEALFRFFEAMPREGPGSEQVTRSLYDSVLDELPDSPRTADMGCGSGAASLVLARAGAQVTCVDIWRPFLDQLEEAAANRAVGDRITTRVASMLESGLASGSLDLVWAEGSVFTVGFDDALACFADLLVPGGVAVVSECSWFVEDPPEEAARFWEAGYPGMRSVAGNLQAALSSGWRFLGASSLQPAVWEEGFYGPMEALMESLGDVPDMQSVVAECRHEIDVFRRISDSFGYVFYALARPGP